MVPKRHLVAAIEALPESASMEEVLERLQQLYRVRQGIARRGTELELDEEDPPVPLAERQLSAASPYQSEFVVLVGEEVIYHGPDRAGALSAYRAALGKSDGRYPVLVAPDLLPFVSPVMRGRELASG